MDWRKAWHQHLEKMSDFWVDQNFDRYQVMDETEKKAMIRKKNMMKARKAEVVKAKVVGTITGFERLGHRRYVNYLTHWSFLIKQKDFYYIEEQLTRRKALFEGAHLVEEIAVDKENEHHNQVELTPISITETRNKGKGFFYDRLSAVKYADRWWNQGNPEFQMFDVDCTNYVSQCLNAGGAPMHGQYNQHAGWWYSGKNWSFSWAVAHSFRWYLTGRQNRLQAVTVDAPEKLMPGDVICYDFEGDGRWDHSTFVTEKDGNHMPLVNAHTTDSRHRYWSYEDSTAWTPNIQYKFFHIDAD
ncbi:amidase domain-containing protein [Camelliibacillus cellulosilyticus]|uniref:Amidase domain-containing protein n=1 Tax=Camelliibacillus cellulosilyticus TaxID=2174486 RepID=A0ABV9GL33_9BACL